jgi:hypothetical protein
MKYFVFLHDTCPAQITKHAASFFSPIPILFFNMLGKTELMHAYHCRHGSGCRLRATTRNVLGQ